MKALIIGETEQKLIITCRKNESGEGEVSFDFDPGFETAVTPEQKAAMSIANVVIQMFNLGQEEEVK